MPQRGSRRCARAGRGRRDRRLTTLPGPDPRLPAAIVPAVITVSLFAFITSWNEFLAALVVMNKDSAFTLPLISPQRDSRPASAGRMGNAQAGVTLRSFHAWRSTCFCKNTTFQASSTGDQIMDHHRPAIPRAQQVRAVHAQRADHPRRRPDCRRLDRHRLEALMRGRLRQENARQRGARRARDRYRPNDWRRACIAHEVTHIGIISNDSFGRFTFRSSRRWRNDGRRGHRGLMCNATTIRAREPASRPDAGQAGGRHGGHPRAAPKARADRAARPRLAG